jgi:hypothetical protein
VLTIGASLFYGLSQNNEFNNVDLPEDTQPIIPKFIVGCIILKAFVGVVIFSFILNI